MKKIIVFAVFAVFAVNGYSQTINRQSDSITTFVFQPKVAVELGKLTDGNHDFISINGQKLVMTVKKSQVSSLQFFSPAGAAISKSISSAIKNALGHSCQTCVDVKYPGGGTARICSSTDCPTANGINSSL